MMPLPVCNSWAEHQWMTVREWGNGTDGVRTCLRCGRHWVERLEKDDRWVLKGYGPGTRAMRDDLKRRAFAPKRVLKIKSYDDLKNGTGQIIRNP